MRVFRMTGISREAYGRLGILNSSKSFALRANLYYNIEAQEKRLLRG